MNKSALIVFALFAVSSVLCDSSEEVLEKVKSKHVRQYLSANREHIDSGLEKLDKHCPGASAKLKTALVAFHECDEKVDESLTMCQAIQTYTLNCTKPLLKVVDDCLPEKAKGLPNLGVKSLLSVADFLCKQTGESIFELANPCLWEDSAESTEEEDECEKKVKDLAKKYENEDTIPTQSEICTAVTGLRGCIQSHSGTSCKNPKTKTVILGLFDALVAPCSNINEV